MNLTCRFSWNWRKLISLFTIRYSLQTFDFAISIKFVKVGHHHFLPLIYILYIETKLYNRSTTLICLFYWDINWSCGTDMDFFTIAQYRCALVESSTISQLEANITIELSVNLTIDILFLVLKRPSYFPFFFFFHIMYWF